MPAMRKTKHHMDYNLEIGVKLELGIRIIQRPALKITNSIHT